MIWEQDLHSMMLPQLIQVTIVASVAWLAWKLFATNRPHLSHAIWSLVLLKCLTPPIFTNPASPFCWSTSRTSATASGFHKVDQPTAQASFFDPIITYAVGPTKTANENAGGAIKPNAQEPNAKLATPIFRFGTTFWWLAGASIGLIFVAFRYAVFCLRLRTSPQDICVNADRCLVDLKQRLGVRRRVRIRVVDTPVGPAVLGLFRPTILLPAVVVRGKSPEQLAPLLAHELIHIRRGDLWWSLLQSIAKCLWWFHPLVWLSGRMLTASSEHSCDEETITGLACEPANYARALLDVLEIKHQLRVAPALPGVRPVDITSKRMERIMSLRNSGVKRCPKWIWAFTCVVAICILPGAAILDAQDPVPAQAPKAMAADVPAPDADQPVDRIQFYVLPQMAAGVPAPDADQHTTRIYKVADVLARIQKECGVDRTKAKEKLLSILPSTEVQPPAAPPVKKIAGVEKFTVRLTFDEKNESLIVETNQRTHKVIQRALKQIRDFGIMQVMVEMTVIELYDQPAVAINGKSGNSDAGVSGQIQAAQPSHAKPQLVFGKAPANEASKVLQQRLAAGTAAVISRPKIITVNGREAAIQVGAALPITAITGDKTQHVDSVTVGFEAKLNPRLINDDQVRIQIESSIRTATGKTKRSTHEHADGITTIREEPEVITTTKSAVVTAKLNEYVLVDGPKTKQVQPIAGVADPTRKFGGKYVTLLACHAISPFDVPEPVKNAAKMVPAAGSPNIFSPPALPARAGQKRKVSISNKQNETRLQVGTVDLQINGTFEVDYDEETVVAKGQNTTIKIYERQAMRGEAWLTMKADQLELVLDPEGYDSEESIREAKLAGNVSLKFANGPELEAESLVVRDGVNIVAATKLKTNCNGFDVEADQLQVDKNRVYHLKGNVVIHQESRTIQADNVQWDPESEKLKTTGSAEFDFGFAD